WECSTKCVYTTCVCRTPKSNSLPACPNQARWPCWGSRAWWVACYFGVAGENKAPTCCVWGDKVDLFRLNYPMELFDESPPVTRSVVCHYRGAEPGSWGRRDSVAGRPAARRTGQLLASQ